ncbi:probable WRKY transcription factor 2 isoform X1 [Oryza brachyantha]|uniref:probable WRKY transcription factor 2 isoform X1 n=1 Tax=Oryza brachyantha TaxID=4533 RepID=UPI001ADC148C|nr:probable WRKY transcription factor 2 isoform X1 [Oryza brachyantha]
MMWCFSLSWDYHLFMDGTNNHGALMDDWMLPSPSPRTLMSSFLNEGLSSGSCSDVFGDNGSNKPQDGLGKSKSFVDSNREETAQLGKKFESNLFGANQKSSSNSCLSDRMASRTGFGVLKIDTSRVGYSAPIRSPVTIPPGVSPRELLESPVFLPNAIAQPSPTTGKLPFLMSSNVKPSIPKKTEDETCHDGVFFFHPILGSKPPSFPVAEKGFSVNHQNQPSVNDDHQVLSLRSSSTAAKDVSTETIVKPKTSDSMLDNGDHPSPANDQEESLTNRNEEYSSDLIMTPAEDGYNWRKYGQKQVKNSEHPRSYFKCTYPNCTVKKKVERSQDGQITEIVYKGSHNHPLPPSNRRASVPFSCFDDLKDDNSEIFGSKSGQCTSTSWDNGPNSHLQDVHSEVLETKPSASLATTEHAETSVMDKQEAVDISSKLSIEGDDRVTHRASLSLGYDANEDNAECKRRKMDVYGATSISTNPIDIGAVASRAVREPRVVVQTTSEVDILDDGYRWRKYGQKVVKGNPNPRSYYKCTHPGCSVRKHVERASHDLKSVITTYEGKHNHEVPAARNSGHPSSGSAAAPQANGLLLHRRPEPAQGGSFPQFGGPAASYGSAAGHPPAEQFGAAAAAGFSFGMLPRSIAIPVPAPAITVRAQTAGRPPAMQGYPGLVLPRGEMKVNLLPQTGLPAANGSTIAAGAPCQQRMGRLPQPGSSSDVNSRT